MKIKNITFIPFLFSGLLLLNSCGGSINLSDDGGSDHRQEERDDTFTLKSKVECKMRNNITCSDFKNDGKIQLQAILIDNDKTCVAYLDSWIQAKSQGKGTCDHEGCEGTFSKWSINMDYEDPDDSDNAEENVFNKKEDMTICLFFDTNDSEDPKPDIGDVICSALSKGSDRVDGKFPIREDLHCVDVF